MSRRAPHIRAAFNRSTALYLKRGHGDPPIYEQIDDLPVISLLPQVPWWCSDIAMRRAGPISTARAIRLAMHNDPSFWGVQSQKIIYRTVKADGGTYAPRKTNPDNMTLLGDALTSEIREIPRVRLPDRIRPGQASPDLRRSKGPSSDKRASIWRT